ncbi:hypothetical protein [Thetidibacter halocola]|uniref:Uncharacterized protein n=1 Tax=Thetidibacter halocola TaxID=2827239 RepID=A0A8J7WFT9_9RHOB|nr:hypothetical protein [Thetidibacter halocola]MBS0124926.1 hypothetical protein [Thetidibacter halocola]
MRSKSLVLTSRDFLTFILVSYAVVIFAFVDAGLRNYLVLFAAMLGGLLFFVFGLRLHRQAFWAFLLLSFMAMQGLFVGGRGELGSVLLTLVYAMGYFAIASMLDRVRDKRAFVQGMMRTLIYAFAILSLIQMAASLVGLPIPNLGSTRGLWSYNSLAFEPSQLGRVVGISMLCYLVLDRLPVLPGHAEESPGTRQKVILAFLTTMLLSGSALAAAAIILVYFMSRSLILVIFLTSASFLIWPLFLLVDFGPLQRVAAILANLGTLDADALLDADESGAVRIIPALIYMKETSILDLEFWFGYGSDGLRRFFLGRIPGLGEKIPAGFVPGFAVVYGIIMAAFFAWIFAFRQANRTTAPLIGFWLIFMSFSAWNTQVFWYGLIVIQVAWAASRENALEQGEVRS